VVLATAVDEAGRHFSMSAPLGIVSGIVLAATSLLLSFQLIRWHPALGITFVGVVLLAGVVAFIAGARHLSRHPEMGFQSGLGIGFGIIMLGALFCVAAVIGLFVLCAIAVRGM
jgi:hypothetical protein